MDTVLQLDTTRFAAAMQQLATLTHREAEVEMRAQAKGIITEAYNITPPASGRKKGDKSIAFDREAQMRGEKKILRDLNAIFVPVTLRGERTITQAFGREMKTPVTVKTVERWPNVEADYRAIASKTKNRRTMGAHRQKRYVDEAKFRALAAKLLPRVGFLASGWNAAAAALKARIPKYARGKNGPGSIAITVAPNRILIVFTNDVRYSDKVPGIQSMLQAAINLQAAKIERQIPFLLAKAAKQSGFRA